jgi:hypothetical protein
MFNEKNLLRHEGLLYAFARSVASEDLWTEGELEFYQIGDTAASRAHAKKPIFSSTVDLEKIEKLKRKVYLIFI